MEVKYIEIDRMIDKLVEEREEKLRNNLSESDLSYIIRFGQFKKK